MSHEMCCRFSQLQDDVVKARGKGGRRFIINLRGNAVGVGGRSTRTQGGMGPLPNEALSNGASAQRAPPSPRRVLSSEEGSEESEDLDLPLRCAGTGLRARAYSAFERMRVRSGLRHGAL